MTDRSTVAILGAGRLGQTVARLALAVGDRVILAGSGAPARIRTIADMFAPGATAAWATDAVSAADIVVLAMPVTAILDDLDPSMLAGKVVIDASNYWPETDGVRPELDDPDHATTLLVQQRHATARVVKALGHVAYRDLAARARPEAPSLAIGVAGDDAGAVRDASAFVRRLGFDPVPVGALAASGILGPRSAVFGAVLDADGFRRRLGEDGWSA